MLISVIIRTKDEAPRLRLVLTSVSRQTVPIVASGASLPQGETAAEVIVVNDGSTDQSLAVLAEAEDWLPLRVVHHVQSRGRSAASNTGARVAAGEVLLFLDGDCLVAPGCLALHALEQTKGGFMGRGETYHLRCTRFFHDPETGSPQPGQQEHVRRLGPDLPAHCVTRQQILEQFAQIARRAQPGIYPGAGPRLLFDLEFDALRNHPDLGVLWMAASGHNFSVRRHEFLAVGGFDEKLTITEHRELAFKLMEQGVRLIAVPGARSYHLAHRIGWRDPMTETDWERIFYAAHPCLAVKLMSIFWLSLAKDKDIPPEARITSLLQMENIVKNGTPIDYDSIRRANPRLADLS